MTVVMTVGGITLSSLENTDIRGQDSLTNMVSRPCLVSDNKTKQYRMTRKGSHNIMAKGLRIRRTVRHSRALGIALTPKAERSEEHTSELQSRGHLVCRLLRAKKNPNSIVSPYS